MTLFYTLPVLYLNCPENKPQRIYIFVSHRGHRAHRELFRSELVAHQRDRRVNFALCVSRGAYSQRAILDTRICECPLLICPATLSPTPKVFIGWQKNLLRFATNGRREVSFEFWVSEAGSSLRSVFSVELGCGNCRRGIGGLELVVNYADW